MERSRLETHLTFLDGLGIGVLSEDADGAVIQINPAVASLLGIERRTSDLLGAPAVDVERELAERFADPEAYLQVTEELRARAVYALAPTRLETRAGRHLGMTYNPVSVEGEYVGCVWVYTDATEHLLLQRELEDSKAALEQVNDQLADSNRELLEAHAAVEEGHRRRVALAVTGAHELRVPLSSALMYVELVTDPGGEPLTDDQRNSLAVAERNLRRMGVLIADMLTLGQLSAAALPVDNAELDVGIEIDWVMDDVAQTTPSSVVPTTRVGLGPALVADPTLLRQVLRNLVDNSLAHTPEHGSVSISADFLDDAWRIVVTDSGAGMDLRDLPQLLDPYNRVASVLAGQPIATGLGLPLVKLIVDFYGGTMDIESEAGQGTTVTVTLPQGGRVPTSEGPVA